MWSADSPLAWRVGEDTTNHTTGHNKRLRVLSSVSRRARRRGAALCAGIDAAEGALSVGGGHRSKRRVRGGRTAVPVLATSSGPLCACSTTLPSRRCMCALSQAHLTGSLFDWRGVRVIIALRFLREEVRFY
eukprot:365238-Chlamydomonas_euryale.AAC.5